MILLPAFVKKHTLVGADDFSHCFANLNRPYHDAEVLILKYNYNLEFDVARHHARSIENDCPDDLFTSLNLVVIYYSVDALVLS